MKTPVKSVAWLLPFVLAGCTQPAPQVQNQPLAPPIVDAPPPAPQSPPADLPPPVVTVPQQPAEQPAQEPEQPKPEDQQPKHAAHRAKTDPNQTGDDASNAAGGSPKVSAIGELSPGSSSDQRTDAEQFIDTVDRGLKAITRPLNDQEQKTAAQIREFLKQSRTALAAGDVDGARTLAVKAKVLLGELNH